MKHLLLLAVLLASFPAVATITVNGTKNADIIVVGDRWEDHGSGYVNQGLYKFVNGTLTALSLTTFEDIDIFGSGGDDEIRIPNSTDGCHIVDGNTQLCAITQRSPGLITIDGGTGADEIYGSDAGDDLYGGTGDDDLYGRGGDDFMIGGAGNDLFFGNAGDDVIIGHLYELGENCWEADVDVGYGGAGDDEIIVGNAAYGEADYDVCHAVIEYSCESNYGVYSFPCVYGG